MFAFNLKYICVLRKMCNNIISNNCIQEISLFFYTHIFDFFIFNVFY
jgi:hypothetical protein